MTTYGFRVYVFEAFHNQKKGNPALEVGAGSDTAAEIVSLLEEIWLGGTVFLDPPPVPDGSDEPAKRTVTVTFSEPVPVGSQLVHLTLSHGEVGARPYARHPSKEAQDISDASAEEGHYMTVLFSSDEKATRFFVVSQTVRRSDPVRLLERLLRERSLKNKVTRTNEQRESRKAMREAGEKRPPLEVYNRLLFERRQAVDNAYLDEIVTGAKTATAEFEARVHSPKSRNADGDVVQRKLRISLLDEKERQISTVVGRRWAERKRSGTATTHTAGVAELAEGLEAGDLMEEGEAGQYNRAAIALSGGPAGASAKIAVDTLREVFTYPVSEGPPQPYQHYVKVAPRIKVIAAEEGVALSDIAPLEVDKCLPD